MAGRADTAKLIAALELKDDTAKGLVSITRGLAGIDKRIDRTASKAEQLGQHIGIGIKNAAKIAAAASIGLGVAAAGIFVSAVKSATDLGETISKVGVVFGAQKDRVLAFGKTTANTLGLSENAALAAAATYGNLFVSMGLAEKQSADMSIRLVTLAGDLASFNNIDPTEALEKLRAGLTGESEPLKTLGININETIIKAKALELGLVKNATTITGTAKSTAELKLQHIALNDATKEVAATTKKYGAGSEQALEATVKMEKAEAKLEGTVKQVPFTLTAAQKAQAAYALILDQSTTAQGDAARTSGGLANQTRILKANWDKLKTTLATPALPKIAAIFQRINALVVEQEPAIAKLGDKIAGLFSDANIKQGADTIKGVFTTIQSLLPAIQSGAEITGKVIQTAVGAFKSLPPEIQALAVAGLAVNKLTGGLVTNIAGGLISAVLKQLVSGVVNVSGAVVNVGGVPGVGPTGPKGPGIITPIIGITAALIAVEETLKGMEEAGAVNTGLRDKGLNAAEIAAIKFYRSDEVAQQTALKHLGRAPSRADFDSGVAKITAAASRVDDRSYDAIEKLRTAIQTDTMSVNIANAADIAKAAFTAPDAKTGRAAILADQIARGVAPTAGPSKSLDPRFAFLRGSHSGSKDADVVEALTTGFERAEFKKSPVWRSLPDLKRAIEVSARDQKQLLKAGDTKNAALIGADVDRMKAELGRRTDAAATKTANAATAAGALTAAAIREQDLTHHVSVTSPPIYIDGRLFKAAVNRTTSTASQYGFENLRP